MKDMDFLGVCDSGDWGDSSDTRDLHAQLFKSSTGKKSKAARKKQASVGKTQKDSKDTNKRMEMHSSEQQQHVIQPKEKNNVDTKQTDTPTSVTATGQNKKRKRRRDTDESRVPVPVKKQKEQSPNTKTEDRERNTEHKSQPNDDSQASQASEDGTSGTEASNQKKKRKRRPRNNKFKTTEFGYTGKQSELELSDIQSKVSLLPDRTDISIPQSSKSEAKTDMGKEKIVKKKSRRAKNKNKNTATKDNSDQQSESKKNEHKNKFRGAQDNLPSPVTKLKNKTSNTLNQTGNAKNEKSNNRTTANDTFNTGDKVKDSKLSNKSSIPTDGQNTAASSAEESTKSAESADDKDEDIGSDSEEPVPDLSAKHALKAKIEAQLQSAHFRFLNEKLYKSTGSQAYQMMASDKEAFDIYHQGFSQQVKQWPVNPVDKFIEDLKSRPTSLTVGDFGCGEASIAQSVSQTVHSFDICALNEHVTICDMKKVPLKNKSLDVAIFCLSLMGTNWINYIKEANRVLKMKGWLKIAEVASRFSSVAEFLKIMKLLGFKNESKDFSNKMFLMFDFSKEAPPQNVELERGEVLRPCLYKRR